MESSSGVHTFGSETYTQSLGPGPKKSRLSKLKLPTVEFSPSAVILGSGKMRMAMSEKLGMQFTAVELNTKGSAVRLVGRALKRTLLRTAYGMAALSELIASIVEIPVTLVRILFHSLKDRPLAKTLAIVHGRVLIENIVRLFYFAPTTVKPLDSRGSIASDIGERPRQRSDSGVATPLQEYHI